MLRPDPSLGGVSVTKPSEFMGFGAMDVTKPYEFIGLGAMDVTKPYEFIGFGAGSLPGRPVRGRVPYGAPLSSRVCLLRRRCSVAEFWLKRLNIPYVLVFPSRPPLPSRSGPSRGLSSSSWLLFIPYGAPLSSRVCLLRRRCSAAEFWLKRLNIPYPGWRVGGGRVGRRARTL